MVHLFNISVTGNKTFTGCSAVMSWQSDVRIENSNFVALQGSFGAAMTIVESCVTFTGNNAFENNTASFGGSLHLFESVVFLNGTNSFMNNNSSLIESQIINDCNSCYRQEEIDTMLIVSGGAIYCDYSNLVINGKYSIFANNFAHSGGAIAANCGNVIIQGSALFEENTALNVVGGAIVLNWGTIIFGGNVSFINNKAKEDRGALMLYVSDLYFIKDMLSPASFDGINDAINICMDVIINGVFWNYKILKGTGEEHVCANVTIKLLSMIDLKTPHFWMLLLSLMGIRLIMVEQYKVMIVTSFFMEMHILKITEQLMEERFSLQAIQI